MAAQIKCSSIVCETDVYLTPTGLRHDPIGFHQLLQVGWDGWFTARPSQCQPIFPVTHMEKWGQVVSFYANTDEDGRMQLKGDEVWGLGPPGANSFQLLSIEPPDPSVSQGQVRLVHLQYFRAEIDVSMRLATFRPDEATETFRIAYGVPAEA